MFLYAQGVARLWYEYTRMFIHVRVLVLCSLCLSMHARRVLCDAGWYDVFKELQKDAAIRNIMSHWYVPGRE